MCTRNFTDISGGRYATGLVYFSKVSIMISWCPLCTLKIWLILYTKNRWCMWRQYGRYGISNHQPHDCLLSRLFRHRWKKHQSSASLAFVRGIHRRSMNYLHKGPVTREKFLFDYVIMVYPYRQLIVYVLNSKKLVNRLWHMQERYQIHKKTKLEFINCFYVSMHHL